MSRFVWDQRLSHVTIITIEIGREFRGILTKTLRKTAKISTFFHVLTHFTASIEPILFIFDHDVTFKISLTLRVVWRSILPASRNVTLLTQNYKTRYLRTGQKLLTGCPCNTSAWSRALIFDFHFCALLRAQFIFVDVRPVCDGDTSIRT